MRLCRRYCAPPLSMVAIMVMPATFLANFLTNHLGAWRGKGWRVVTKPPLCGGACGNPRCIDGSDPLLPSSSDFSVAEYCLREANEDRIILPSNVRLHIAKQVTSAVSYLHTAFARPIIHRDPKPSCLFLDDDYVPKLYNFLLSITIPPMVLGFEDDVTRTIGYIDIIYLWSNRIIEKTNMYSFGVLLLVFLTRRKDLESNQAEGIDLLISYVRSFDGRIEAVVDPKIYEEVRGNVQVQ
ncbi:non-functional pseudokinase ZRK2-like [Malus domestica]|uniref:non-functional pseudokinase ZRK2-like n=1 Tax=Malus domestica TaxID=3750 RepID=UPI003974FBAF